MKQTLTCSMIAVMISVTGFVTGRSVNAQAPPAASGSKATLTAKLIDPDKKAAERAATVEVTVSGVELVDPAMSNEKPVSGQAHLHYQVDKGPVIATPTAKLTFHELTPGTHTIVVILAGNDHKPLAPQQQLTVTVPKAGEKPRSTSGGEPKPKGY